MLEFLKALVEKLRVDLLLASLAIAILLFKIFGFDAWWMVFAFCVTYIFMLGVEKWVKAIREKRGMEKQERANNARSRQEAVRHNEEVWKRFYALDSQVLDLLKTIYQAETDPANPLIRYIHDGGVLAYEIERNNGFRVPEGDRLYCPLLYAEHLANASVITFHPYYLDLLEHYVKTGRKERV